jgi:hypothetical protein
MAFDHLPAPGEGELNALCLEREADLVQKKDF